MELPEKKKNAPLVPATIQSALIEIVSRKDIDPDRLEKFLDLQIKMEDRQAKVEYNAALAGFQGECPIIQKTKHVKFKSVDYKYSPIEEIVKQIKPILTKLGLSYSFNVRTTEDKMVHELITKISHSSGHSEEYSHFFKPLHDDERMNQSQRIKSAITFAKRAGLESALGIVTSDEDDDARSATDKVAPIELLNEIESLIKETGANRDKFMSYLGAESLENISEAAAKRGIQALKQKAGK